MKKLLTLTLILALAATTVVMAQPAPRGGGNCDGPGFGPQGGKHHGMGMHKRDGAGLRMILAHGDEIGLTDQQREQLEKMQFDFQTQRVDQKASLEKAEIKLRTLMRDEADEAQVMAAIDNVSKLKADMQKMRYKHRMEAKSVLTEDQATKLKELRKNCRDFNKQRPGGQGRGPGFGG